MGFCDSLIRCLENWVLGFCVELLSFEVMQIICSMIFLLVMMVMKVSGFSDFEALLELKKGFQGDPSRKVLTS